MATLHHRLRQLSRAQGGATAVEYGLMIGLIAIVVIVVVTLLGSTLSDLFDTGASSV